MRICAVGDIAPRRADPTEMFISVKHLLGGADLCFGQMECPVSDRGVPSPHARLAMRTSPDVAPALRGAGFSLMSVAGNHALDFGREALADTLGHLAAAGIAVAGAGANIATARRPAVVRNAGQSVALLAYSSILPAGYAADAQRAGCAPMRAHTEYEQIEHDQPGTPPRIHTFADRRDLRALEDDIRAARKSADIVLVSLHWGIHFVRAQLADYQREIATAAIAAGADAILGHHPHLLKGVEFIAGKPVFYSLGNFAIEQPAAFDAAIADHESFKHLQSLSSGWRAEARYQSPPETRHTMIASLDFRSEVAEVMLHPCRIDDDSCPRPISPGSAEMEEWIAYMRAITHEAGLTTAYSLQPDGVVSCRSA